MVWLERIFLNAGRQRYVVYKYLVNVKSDTGIFFYLSET